MENSLDSMSLQKKHPVTGDYHDNQSHDCLSDYLLPTFLQMLSPTMLSTDMIGCSEATIIELRLTITEWKERGTLSISHWEYQGS
jgi:hypothetical protein